MLRRPQPLSEAQLRARLRETDQESALTGLPQQPGNSFILPKNRIARAACYAQFGFHSQLKAFACQTWAAGMVTTEQAIKRQLNGWYCHAHTTNERAAFLQGLRS